MATNEAKHAEEDAPRAPGGNNLSNIKPEDVDRVIPRPGEALEQNPATDPDKASTSPDDSGNRARPL